MANYRITWADGTSTEHSADEVEKVFAKAAAGDDVASRLIMAGVGTIKVSVTLATPFLEATTAKAAAAPAKSKGKGTKAPKAEREYEPAQVREWQGDTGRKVTLKGRFPDADIAAYLAEKAK